MMAKKRFKSLKTFTIASLTVLCGLAAMDSVLAETSAQSVLAAAAQEFGAHVTSSGLVIRMVKEGKGTQPTPASTVKVHYRGTFPNGQEFDSSYKRGEPIEFPLRGVIPCWTEGVSMMKVGAKAKLTCPSSIAYGARGAGGVIPPNATLVFDVELLEVR